MTKKVKLKKEFPNPFNIQARTKITNKILIVRLSGNEVEVEFENEPTEGDIQAIKQYLDHNPYWKVIKR